MARFIESLAMPNGTATNDRNRLGIRSVTIIVTHEDERLDYAKTFSAQDLRDVRTSADYHPGFAKLGSYTIETIEAGI